MTIPGARTRSRILGLDGPHRGMFCLAWDWTVTLSIRLVTPCNPTPPRSAWIGSGDNWLSQVSHLLHFFPGVMWPFEGLRDL